jgi:hypothetical protein
VALPQTFGFNKTFGNIAVPILGAVLLLMVGVHFSRGIDWLGLSSITLGCGAVGAAYFQIRRGLNQLRGAMSDTALSKLCLAANSMAIFGYGICIVALGLIRWH